MTTNSLREEKMAWEMEVAHSGFLAISLGHVLIWQWGVLAL